LVSPANNQKFVELNPELKWNKVNIATSYEIEFDITNDFSESVMVITEDTTTLDAIKFELKANSTYFWRVRAVNNSIKGDWSETWSFTTSPEIPTAAVKLLSPENNATEIIPDRAGFSWELLEDAQFYRFQVSKTNDFATKVVDTVVTNKNSCYIYDFEKLTDYFWRVLPGNVIGEGSNWSEIRTFKTSNETSIFDFNFTSFINISPNPANNFAVCNFGLLKSANITLFIYDALGNEVQKISKNCESGNHSIDLNINQFASGNYICKIVANNKIIASTQFIIAK
jgi:hypothetical protein